MITLRTTLSVVPRDLRERYAQEWAADLAEAHALGLDPEELQWGFQRTAQQLRRRRVLRILQGRQGVGLFLAIWGAAALCLFAVFTWALPLLSIIGISVVITGHPQRRAPLAVLGFAWLTTFSFSVWAWGAGFDYADANLPAPAWAQWWLPSFLTSVACLAGFVTVALRDMPRRASAS